MTCRYWLQWNSINTVTTYGAADGQACDKLLAVLDGEWWSKTCLM